MNVAALRELIEDLPDDMRVIIPAGDGIYLALCRKSEVTPVEYPDTEPEEMLLLLPCECNSDDLPIDIEVNPN